MEANTQFKNMLNDGLMMCTIG